LTKGESPSSSPLTKGESPSSSPLTKGESPSSSPLLKGGRGGSSPHFETITELLTNLDTNLCRHLLTEILPNLTLLDPACGSGAFLVAAMKTLIYIYSTVIGTSKFLNDRYLNDYLKDIEKEHSSLNYYIKKRIITDNLYGVDIMPEAVEIAKLRLFLALVSAAQNVNDLEPLPNIDFNIMAGNSLIGLLRVDDAEYEGSGTQLNLFHKTYRQVLEEKNRLISIYRHATTYSQNLQSLRDEIAEKKAPAIENINKILLEDFQQLKIKFEQSQISGKPIKRSLSIADIEALQPFHWGYEFDEILHQRGGFDAIITNPPWEIFKPDAKEFFADHSNLVTKKKMDIKSFEKEQKKLLQDIEVSNAWLEYQSNFPHISAYYRSAEQYKNQISIVNGKKAGTDINLYKLFVEQCFNLLRRGGECGIVIPSGIYTDLGTKQLREMLFSQTKVTGLFCLENRKTIFEGVHKSFKIVVLTFEKDGITTEFPSAFMRLDVDELQRFPSADSLQINVELVRKLSPDSLSVMEFKNEGDIRIAEKMLQFPLLGEQIEGKWNLRLCNEFHMTNDSHLFKQEPGKGRLQLFVGKMFNQFEITKETTPYWIYEQEGRKALLGKKNDYNQLMDYQCYRWVHRRIARNTDKRTLICHITPKMVFTEVNSTTLKVIDTGISNSEMIFLCAMCNSFVVDWLLRQKVTTTLNMFYIYQLPLPRLTSGDKYFTDIVQRAAKLICTTPEFDELAQEVGLNSHREGVTDETERAQLRAELDGIIAHLYGLTDAEFTYILTTFPIVPETVKQAALAAYRTFRG
ncbi:MAG: DNA methyltransferase, partial [Microcoleus sp.]